MFEEEEEEEEEEGGIPAWVFSFELAVRARSASALFSFFTPFRFVSSDGLERREHTTLWDGAKTQLQWASLIDRLALGTYETAFSKRCVRLVGENGMTTIHEGRGAINVHRIIDLDMRSGQNEKLGISSTLH